MKYCPICTTDFAQEQDRCPHDGAKLVDKDEWAPGLVIRNKYRIISRIGRGGMGIVYKAEHLVFKDLWALKVMYSRLSSESEFVRRFYLEAEKQRRLKHPNVVRVDDIDQAEDGKLFIGMEFVDGMTLRDMLIAAQGPLAMPLTQHILRGMGGALEAADALGIVHRDIKPDNILLERGAGGLFTPKLADFGVAKLRDSTASMSRAPMLTPQYAAPEQWSPQEDQPPDGRTDLYALGMTAYEMLAARLPFTARNDQEWMYAHLNQEPPPPSDFNPELLSQPLWDEIILRLIAKDRNDRYADASEFLGQLNRLDLPITTSFAAGAPTLMPELAQTIMTPAVVRRPGTAPPARPGTNPPARPISVTAPSPARPASAPAAAAAAPARAPVRPTSHPASHSAGPPARPVSRPPAPAAPRPASRPASVPAARPPARPLSRTVAAPPPVSRPVAPAPAPSSLLGEALADDSITIPDTGDDSGRGAGFWMVVIVLLLAAAGGGWYYWANYLRPAAPASVAETVPAPEDQTPAPTPGTPTPTQAPVTKPAPAPTTEAKAAPAPPAPARPDAPPSELAHVLTGDSAAVYSVAFSPRGRWLASSDQDGDYRLWDFARGRAQAAVPLKGDIAASVAVSPNGQIAAVGNWDRAIDLVSIPAGHEIRKLTGHTGGVEAVAFVNSSLLVSGADDRTVREWRVADGSQVRVLHAHSGAVRSLAVSRSGATIASGSSDQTIILWDAASGRELRTLLGDSATIRALAFSPDGRWLASASDDHSIRLWDVATGQQLLVIGSHQGVATAVAFSPDGHWLASGGGDNAVKIWRTSDWLLQKTLTVAGGGVRGLAFSPDGEWLAAAAGDATVRLWQKP